MSNSIKLTDEQKAIIDFSPQNSGSMVVNAFAGTGKTFTLQHYAEKRPSERMLYMAYNKAIQQDADRKMPHNVECRTVHSVAYASQARPYVKLNLLKGYVPLWVAAKKLKTNIVLANFALQTVNKFIASADTQIGEQHMADDAINYFKGVKSAPPIVNIAKAMWEDMVSLSPDTLPMTHDGYLKLYQLSEPVLPFDYILLDEAQDTTLCVWDILSKQSAKKIIVGDKNQAIYGWRGATNIMGLVKDAERFSLTQSFRFGPEVADLASVLLRRFCNEKKTLTGNPDLDTTVTFSGSEENHISISRGNNSIFRSVVNTCNTTDKSIGFVGGDLGNYRFNTVLDAYHLLYGKSSNIKDPIIKTFRCFDDLKEFATKTKNAEYDSACNLVQDYGSEIPKIYSKAKARDVGAQYADQVYTTAHKSKGLEFPIVQLADDFKVLISTHINNPELKILDEFEMNLLYVAITRATKRLHMRSSISGFIHKGSLEGPVKS